MAYKVVSAIKLNDKEENEKSLEGKVGAAQEKGWSTTGGVTYLKKRWRQAMTRDVEEDE